MKRRFLLVVKNVSEYLLWNPVNTSSPSEIVEENKKLYEQLLASELRKSTAPPKTPRKQ